MPATEENCAICAIIWVLSTGLNGSWFLSCAVISVRKSACVSVELPEALAVAADAAAVELAMPRLESVLSKDVLVVMVSGPS